MSAVESVFGIAPKTKGDPIPRSEMIGSGLDEASLKVYSEHNPEAAKNLRESYRRRSSLGPSKVLYSQEGKDISNLRADFLSWANKQNVSSANYSTYLKEEKNAPGRKATILAPEKTTKSVLGG